MQKISRQLKYYRKVAGTKEYIYRRLFNNIQRNKDKLGLSRDEFYWWYNTATKKCYYCKIPEGDISKGFLNHKLRTKKLTVDRKDSTRGYELENIVHACDTCNRIKGNIFTPEEMKIIGKIIRTKYSM